MSKQRRRQQTSWTRRVVDGRDFRNGAISTTQTTNQTIREIVARLEQL